MILFEELKDSIEAEGLLISGCISVLSILDVNCGLSRVCAEYGYVRPMIDTCVPLMIESSIASTLSLKDVRHLVVEDMIMKQNNGKTFIPNSLQLDCSCSIRLISRRAGLSFLRDHRTEYGRQDNAPSVCCSLRDSESDGVFCSRRCCSHRRD